MGMYEDYYYKGKSIAEWRKELNNEYSLVEIYRMAKDGADFFKMVIRQYKKSENPLDYPK